jgi:DNA modification methylase
MPSQLLLSLPKAREVGIDRSLWEGSFNGRESSMHQLAPYVGKLKSGMARVLVEEFSKHGEVVLDPFCGSGVVPYEALLARRHSIGNDLSPYACVLTRGKLSAPATESEAIRKAQECLAEAACIEVRTETVPDWVKAFFNPKTLEETIALMTVLRDRQDYFLQSCLLGILHHVRPGFLSFPASHLVPYLRVNKYPRDAFPEMYLYRSVAPRLLAKIHRAYRRFETPEVGLRGTVLQENAASLSLKNDSVDAIVSSPPYYGALDYGRDNRLRLWFLGVTDYKKLEVKLTSNNKVYIPEMTRAVAEMLRVLKSGKCAALVLGDYNKNGQTRDSATALIRIVHDNFSSVACAEKLLVDEVPDERRTRRLTRTTKQESVILIKKT